MQPTNLVDALTNACKELFFSKCNPPDPTVSEPTLFDHAKSIRNTWEAHTFDKATHKVWLTCNVFAAVLWVKCFIEDPRKSETFRARSHIEARLILLTYLLCGAKHFLSFPIPKRPTKLLQSNPLFPPIVSVSGLVNHLSTANLSLRVTSPYGIMHCVRFHIGYACHRRNSCNEGGTMPTNKREN